MTINEYKSKLPEGMPQDMMDALADTMELWNNGAATGYAICAAEEIGLKRDKITLLISAMRWAYDTMTIEEAEKYYQQF